MSLARRESRLILYGIGECDLRKVFSMKWETPAFVEINMSAEIGGYQTDFEDDHQPAGPGVPRTEPVRDPAPRA